MHMLVNNYISTQYRSLIGLCSTLHILFLLSMLFSPLLSQNIISDTVYVSDDATFIYQWENDHLSFSSWSGTNTVGDGIDFDGNRIFMRSFLSFDLSEVMIDTTEFQLVGVTLELYQSYSQGDGTASFPLFGGTDRFPCIVDHIEVGEYDLSDWTAGDELDDQTLNSNIGVISNTPEDGYRHLNILPYLWSDYTSNRSHSQFRLRFEIDHDDDWYGDLINFYAFAAPEGEYDPKVFLTWQSTTSIAQTQYPSDGKTLSLSVYPNPFNSSIQLNWYPIGRSWSLSIFDLKGQLLDRKSSSEISMSPVNSTSLQISDLNMANHPSGVYVIQLTVDNVTESIKALYLK